MMEKNNTYERNKLYEEVWSMPLGEVSKIYDISSNVLRNVCNALAVPLPIGGYGNWKRSMWRHKRTDLPELNGPTVIKGIRGTRDDSAHLPELLSFLSEEDRENVFHIAQNVKIKEKLTSKLASYKKSVHEWRSRRSKLTLWGNCTYMEPSLYDDKTPHLAYSISKENTERALRILNTIIDAIEKTGGYLNDDYQMIIRGEIVPFKIYEMQQSSPHQKTSQEEKKWNDYLEDLKKSSWASKPTIPSTDYEFDGRLCLKIEDISRYICMPGECKFFRDEEGRLLESKLEHIIYAFLEASEIVRIRREKKELEERTRRKNKGRRKAKRK